MKFYETGLFMSRCSPGSKLTKQQQLWPALSKSKEEVKWFSWLVGFMCRILWSDTSKNLAQFCQWTQDYVSSWWQVSLFFCQWTVNGEMFVLAWLSSTIVLLRKFGSNASIWNMWMSISLVCAQQHAGVHTQHYQYEECWKTLLNESFCLGKMKESFLFISALVLFSKTDLSFHWL